MPVEKTHTLEFLFEEKKPGFMIHCMDLLQEKGSTFGNCYHEMNPAVEDWKEPLTGQHPISSNRL